MTIQEKTKQSLVNQAGDRIASCIFRSYDIRGVVARDLTEKAVRDIGRALGSEIIAAGENSVVVGRDGRNSGTILIAQLIQGLRMTGCEVIDIGMVPTPLVYFAVYGAMLSNNGVMLTGSHNDPEYNGIKMVLGRETLALNRIQKLKTRIDTGDIITSISFGALRHAEVVSLYKAEIQKRIRPMTPSRKIVVDGSNGVAGLILCDMLRAYGHAVVPLYCEIDGNFPNHLPDPSQPENLSALRRTVIETNADLGLALDGDGDRLVVVDGMGEIIWPDRQIMLFAADLLAREPGATIIYDVKCSGHLRPFIEQHGGVGLMWKTGHSLIKRKMRETSSLFAGEMSGHLFFKENWYGFDDATYAAIRLLAVFDNYPDITPTDIFSRLPKSVDTPELRIPMAEEQHERFMEMLLEQFSEYANSLVCIDGIRLETEQGFGLIRRSNTSAYLTLRFEADDDSALRRIQDIFRRAINRCAPELATPF